MHKEKFQNTEFSSLSAIVTRASSSQNTTLFRRLIQHHTNLIGKIKYSLQEFPTKLIQQQELERRGNFQE